VSTPFQRACACWFDRVMRAGLSGRTLIVGYALKQHFNAVTHDAWPSHQRLSNRYRVCTKTIHRGMADLAEGKFIVIAHTRRKNQTHRYAPLFICGDWDCSDHRPRQNCPGAKDRTVQQSSLVISSSSTFLTPAMIHEITLRDYAMKSKGEPYNRLKRAGLEFEVANRLGNAGGEILDQLHAFDDLCVERLCVAQHYGALTEHLLTAARLAARYLSKT
jgi:hypothetical protein